MKYYEVSSKDNINIEKVFTELIEEVDKKIITIQKDSENYTSLDLNKKNKFIKNCC